MEAVDDESTVLCAACRQAFVARPSTDARRFSRMAVASLALGIASTLFWCVAGVPAVVLGVLALIEIRRHPDQLKGRQFAITGIITGCLLGVICLPILTALLLPAFQALRSGK
jgi:hypothetical protein